MLTTGPLSQRTMHLPVSIDASLARFVRRAYFKRLTDEWGESGKLLKKAQQRNLNSANRVLHPVLLECDAGPARYQRVLRQLIKAESGG